MDGGNNTFLKIACVSFWVGGLNGDFAFVLR